MSKSKPSLCPRGDNSLVGEVDINGTITRYGLSQENTRYKRGTPATYHSMPCEAHAP